MDTVVARNESVDHATEQFEIVGRDRELSRLETYLDGLPVGPSGLLIEGEPGVGKTVLWERAVSLALQRSFRVLAARPTEPERRLSFVGLTDLLDTATTDELLSSLPEPQARALTIALLRSEAAGRRSDPRTIGVAALGVLGGLAREGPLLLAVDDLQWLDRSSARVLAFALRRLRDEGVGLLVTRRASTAEDLEVDITTSIGGKAAQMMRLGSLSLGAIDRVVRVRLGAAVPRPVLVEIHRRTGGNALFALQAATSLDPTPPPHGSGADPVPADHRAVFLTQLARLPPGTEEVLAAAAATAQPTVTLLTEVYGPPTGDLLRAAIAAGLIVIDGGRVRFRHPLIASAVLSIPSEEGLRRLHALLARSTMTAEDRAVHLALATASPEGAVAEEVTRAAEAAMERGAPDAAANLFAHARRLTPETEPEAGWKRSLAAAECHFAAGDISTAVRVAELTMASMHPGSYRAKAKKLLGELYSARLEFSEARVILSEASLEAGQDHVLLAEIELALNWAVQASGDVWTAAPHAHAALDHASLACADGVGDDGLLAEALAEVAMMDFLLGAGLDETKIARALALEDHDRPRLLPLRPSLVSSLALFWAGRTADAHRIAERLRQHLVERGEEAWLALVLALLIQIDLLTGDVDGAGRLVAEAEDAALAQAGTVSRALFLAAKGMLDCHRGDLDGAAEASQESHRIFQELGWVPACALPMAILARTRLQDSDWRGVDELVGPLAQLLVGVAFPEPSQAPFMADEIEALIALGRLDDAERLLTWLEERGRALDRPAALVTGARARGLLYAARGETRRALEATDAALAFQARLDDRLELGRTLMSRGEIERRARKWAPARASLEEAVRTFEQLGAAGWADAARRQLERVGGRRRGPSLALTATERRVAELAATGQSTREVADAAFLSPKTVENMLTSVYRKLGVRSRAELAAHLTTEPLPTS